MSGAVKATGTVCESAAVVRSVDAAVLAHASHAPDAVALVDAERSTSYAELADDIAGVARTLTRLGVGGGDRVAVIATKRTATVTALFGVMRVGAVAVPINPQLKLEQIRHILVDSGARVLFAPPASRGLDGAPFAATCPSLEHVLVTGVDGRTEGRAPEDAVPGTTAPREADLEAALILYTSGSTARPKGVVLSHSNLAHGAASVAEYLGNGPDDRLLALMPLSFDYGLSQITSAFVVGAGAVLFDYLVPKGVVSAVVRHRITGLAAVPHLWNQLAGLDWPSVEHLRYVTSTGGRMPRETTRALARALPTTDIVLMYGFTEAFRSTWLPPAEVGRRPDSIGKAVPHADVLVVDERGRECAPGEIGELIHGGPFVAAGYWGDEAATRARFRPRFSDPDAGARHPGDEGDEREDGKRPGTDPAPGEVFAWSGDLVRRDDEGFLYFVSRREDLVKLHGYRVNPAEIEEIIGRSVRVSEVCVVCVAHPLLGQAAIALVVADARDADAIGRHCREHLPRFMQPERIVTVAALPAGPNSKVDRRALRETYAELFADAPAGRDGSRASPFRGGEPPA